jgi:hypothetical protein
MLCNCLILMGSDKPALLKEKLLWIILQQLLSGLCQKERLIANVSRWDENLYKLRGTECFRCSFPHFITTLKRNWGHNGECPCSLISKGINNIEYFLPRLWIRKKEEVVFLSSLFICILSQCCWAVDRNKNVQLKFSGQCSTLTVIYRLLLFHQ